MKIIMVWGQRICRYPGQFAPELLVAVSEYTDDDNPSLVNLEFSAAVASGDFETVKVITSSIDDDQLARILGENKIEMELEGGVQ